MHVGCTQNRCRVASSQLEKQGDVQGAARLKVQAEQAYSAAEILLQRIESSSVFAKTVAAAEAAARGI